MKKIQTVGIDISKKTLDWHLELPCGKVWKRQSENSQAQVQQALSELNEAYGLEPESLVVCAEYTGRYIYPLVQACKELGAGIWLAGGAEIKLSLGMRRGKNDQVDAQRIFEYSCRFKDKMALYDASCEDIEKLSVLGSERRSYVVDRARYAGQVSDLDGYIDPQLYKQRCKRLKKLIATLDASIKAIDREIEKTVKGNSRLARQYEIITSIDGIGPRIAMATIIATKGFSKFTDPRKFACHIGVAPFEYTSGSSQRTRAKVSHRADKALKSLFHMGALSSLRLDGDMKKYFERKVQDGKNKMSVINAIRGKLIHRVFALIRDDRTFSKKHDYSMTT